MFHRILEAFFLAQVLLEDLAERAVDVRSKVFATVKPKATKHKNPRPAAYSPTKNSRELHGFETLPAKLYSLFRQCVRFLFISCLAAILGKD